PSGPGSATPATRTPASGFFVCASRTTPATGLQGVRATVNSGPWKTPPSTRAALGSNSPRSTTPACSAAIPGAATRTVANRRPPRAAGAGEPDSAVGAGGRGEVVGVAARPDFLVQVAAPPPLPRVASAVLPVAQQSVAAVGLRRFEFDHADHGSRDRPPLQIDDPAAGRLVRGQGQHALAEAAVGGDPGPVAAEAGGGGQQRLVR